MLRALHLSAYGPTERDLSAAFVQGAAELQLRGAAELVGRVELQFAERLEGTGRKLGPELGYLPNETGRPGLRIGFILWEFG